MTQALKAQFIFERDRDYVLVSSGAVLERRQHNPEAEVVIVDPDNAARARAVLMTPAATWSVRNKHSMHHASSQKGCSWSGHQPVSMDTTATAISCSGSQLWPLSRAANRPLPSPH